VSSRTKPDQGSFESAVQHKSHPTAYTRTMIMVGGLLAEAASGPITTDTGATGATGATGRAQLMRWRRNTTSAHRK
jgi:hypothetical protein